MWNKDQLHLLIAKRRNRNAKYHDIPGSSRGKFQNLVRDHTQEIVQGIEPELEYDTLRNYVHVFERARRREKRWRNHTPLPTYKEVSSMINMSRHEFLTDNVSNINDTDRNSGYNTNDVSRNLDNATYLSLPNLANTISTSNISASQNNSNISMLDIGGSQPSCIENINKED
ncbi:478_t:CDS:2 [Scutellospora calospora]|uniref:478_t:CDS:1 n=1 Tax=Scutellospora calospora TaxID=85575 RepID=A0ACA9M982_9GLOM|nr:478_t:CDS:2 [Scutellospora calospora]